MKRVMIISYHFPSGFSAGGVRAQGLAHHLPEFGWEVTVITARYNRSINKPYRVIETGDNDAFTRLQRLFGLDPRTTIMSNMAGLKKRLGLTSERTCLDFFAAAFGEVFAYPDAHKGWYKRALATVRRTVSETDFDAVITVSPPESCHLIGRQIKQEYGLPWVADFTDLWSQNQYYPYSRLRRWCDRRLEKKTLMMADSLVATSNPSAQELSKLHDGREVEAIASGFEPISTLRPPPTTSFSITYTGNIYPGKQSPEPLFVAVQQLIANGTIDPAVVRIRFFGAWHGWIEKLADKYGLKKIVVQHGLIPQDEAQKKQMESQLLLLLMWNDTTHRGIVPYKLFEYFAAGRPILAVGGYDDAVHELLDETQTGVWGQEPDDIKPLLMTMYEEFTKSGLVKNHADENALARYTHLELARSFSKILNNLLA